MKKLLVLGLLMLPCSVLAAEDCQVEEFADHFEVTCVGDAKPIPIPKEGLSRASQPLQQIESSAPVQQNATVPPADSAATSQPVDAAKTSVPAPSQPYAKMSGRQGRPSSADMNAAIEARRKLIQQMRPQTQPAAQ